ncbi:MAG: MerR family transcriptional regulator [Adlercreutzia sp.]|nr:MerR family transcriptional regulator [Adlercreutzia sp.]
MEYLNVGQMAKENCVSSRTLRFYQERGLLEPAFVDEANGRRYYTITQAPRIDLITQLQSAGFSLDEITGIIEDADMGRLQQAMAEKLEQTRARLAELDAARRASEDLLAGLEAFHTTPIRDNLLFAHEPDRLIVRLDAVEPAVMATWEEEGIAAQMERTQCHIKKQLAVRNLPASLLRNSGVIVAKEAITPEAQLFHHTPFVRVAAEDKADGAEVLPGGNALVMYTTFDAADPADRAQSRVARMLDYAWAKDLEITGPLISESVTRFEHYFNPERRPFYRISLPVRSRMAWNGNRAERSDAR